MEDFTIVVQGPLTKASTCACVHFLDHYNEDYPVVISTWNSDNNETVEVPEGVTVVYDDLPDREQGKLYDPQSTFYWAVKSQYNAVANVKTKYVVKTRTDEGFYPIKNIIDSYREGDAEVLFGNVFFKPFKEYAYHIGDHLYVCETEVAVRALKTLLDIYEDRQKPQDWAVQNVNRSDENSYCAEQILAFAFLEALGLRRLVPFGSIYAKTWAAFRTRFARVHRSMACKGPSSPSVLVYLQRRCSRTALGLFRSHYCYSS